jgi:ABC-type transport system substrate-binding protein
MERAQAETSTARAAVSNIAGVEAVDVDTVRFTAANFNPIPWEDLLWLPIMSKGWAERHDGALPSKRPFMLAEFEPGERTVLLRNPNRWGLAQHPHNI